MNCTIQELEKLNIRKWYIDMDGVILHSNKTIVDMLNKQYNKHILPEQITKWNYECCFPETNKEEIEQMFDSNYFFSNVCFIEGSKDFILRHIKDIVIITKGNSLNIHKKRLLLDNNGLSKCKMIGIPLSESKNIIKMKNSIFIDDVESNLKDVKTAKYKILFKEYDNITEWSKNWNGLELNKWI